MLHNPVVGARLRVLSLCFKDVPGTCGDTEGMFGVLNMDVPGIEADVCPDSKNWLSLADDLIDSLDKVRDSLQLDLKVVVDGRMYQV